MIWDKYFDVDLQPELIIGKNFSATRDLTIQCAGKITIGNDVLIASNVFICNENHGSNPTIDNYLNQPLDVKDIVIEDGVWIGEKVCVLPGVKIGKKSIIGAGAIVTKNIPPYTIAVGNPARVVKRYDFVTNEWRSV